MEEREKFRRNLDNFLVDLQIERELHQDFDEKRIYENASTKEERQNYLDKFFRVICLQVIDSIYCIVIESFWQWTSYCLFICLLIYVPSTFNHIEKSPDVG